MQQVNELADWVLGDLRPDLTILLDAPVEVGLSRANSRGNPDRLDVGRDTRNMVQFGRGAHYCLGANLARQELSWIYEAALDFLPREAKVVEHQIEKSRIGIFSRMETLPIDFGTGRA